MEKRRMLTLFILSATLLLLLTSQTGDISSIPSDAVEQETTQNTVKTIFDPSIVRALADTGVAQQVSFRTTHELSIIEITDLENEGITFRRRNGQVTHAGCIYLAEIANDGALDALTSIGYVEQIDADSNLNEILLDESISDMGANLTYMLRDPMDDSQNITGHGVTVAIIDTGIDWQSPDFYFADGGEYFYRYDALDGYYIDLNDNSLYDLGEKTYYFDIPGDGGTVSVFDPAYDWSFTDTNNNAAYDYGIDFGFVANDHNDNGVLDIEETCIMLDTCKITQIWDQTTGDFFVRDVNLTNPAINTQVDTNGHGTHVAGTIAGGQFGYRTFVGVAPDAEIMMIKTSFYSNDIMDAVIWAVNEGADIISMSIGGYINRPLDGSTNYELTFDWAFDQGVPSTVSAGNSADDEIHSSVDLQSSTETSVRFEVTGEGQSTVYLTTLWRDSSNSLSLRIQPPYPIIPSPIFSIPLGGSSVNVENNLVSADRYTSPRGTAYIVLTITYQSPLTGVETGTWTLYVNNPSGTDEFTHTYIYPAGYNKMVDYVDSSYTLSSPATADNVIAVASYVTKLGGSSTTLGNISVFSSIGPRIDNLTKPEIAAPGELIMATSSADAGGAFGGHHLLQGTSMACPHTAGVLALQVQCHPTGLSYSSSSLRNDLLNSADVDAFTGSVPNDVWGYGKIDAYEAVIREWPQTGPVISEVSVDESPIAHSQTIDVVRGTQILLSVQVSDDQSYLDLNVSMEYSELGEPVVGVLPLTYDSLSGRWNISLTFNEVEDLVVYNLTMISNDPLFSASPHSIFIDLQNELPEIHSIYLNTTSIYRTTGIEFTVNASDYRDLANLTVQLCLQQPDASWLNVTTTWNNSFFVRAVLFNTTDQIGWWNAYVLVSDQDGGIASEYYGSFEILNNIPAVSGSLVDSTVTIGTDISIDASLSDIEDAWLLFTISLKDSSDTWYNDTIYTDSTSEIFTTSSIGLSPGIYEVYLTVVDADGGLYEFYVGLLTLDESTAPTIDDPSDVFYSEFDSGYSIIWDPSDLNPSSYVIYLEGIPVKSGAWNISSETISISVDGHGLGSYNYTIKVTDIDSNTAISTVFVYVSDGTNPVIDTPTSIEYDEFDTGYSITWNPSDVHPVSYVIYVEGIPVKSGAWNISSETISISVDGLGLGSYNYTIVVTDVGGNIGTSTVFTTVVDGTPPTIDSPIDIEYTEGVTENIIVWNPDDHNPSSYEVFNNGVSLGSNSWSLPLESIPIVVDGLSPGEYNYTILVTDVGGNFVSDSVNVTVIASTITTTTTTTTTTSTTTSTTISTTTTTSTSSTTTDPQGDLSELIIMIIAGGSAGIIIIVVILIIAKKRG